MAYKMKGFSGFKNSPAKQIDKELTNSPKTYPEGYTEKDIKFLKELKKTSNKRKRSTRCLVVRDRGRKNLQLNKKDQ